MKGLSNTHTYQLEEGRSTQILLV